MEQLVRHPAMFFLLSFALMTLGTLGSVLFLRRKRRLDSDEQADFSIVQAATLTLLALLIGFSFSMAVSRYDQRKNYEEEEANAIGTEFLRADLMPASSAALTKSLLKEYLQLRIAFYQNANGENLKSINIQTAQVQESLWRVVLKEGKNQPTPVIALVVSGMNDVLNSQGYTQAAWGNRIPVSAWALMMMVALFCSMLIGYSARCNTVKNATLLIMPLMISISMALIADIDSPRGGFIHVAPQNLQSLLHELK
ncbi:MAG: hypothetical protein RSC68_04520 [Acinetobacter sp.]